MKEAIIQYEDTPSGGLLAISWKPLVRCKDCKHYDETQRGTPRAEKRRYVCDDFNPPDDWFCADGERKEGR